jgi:hypothetical protein
MQRNGPDSPRPSPSADSLLIERRQHQRPHLRLNRDYKITLCSNGSERRQPKGGKRSKQNLSYPAWREMNRFFIELFNIRKGILHFIDSNFVSGTIRKILMGLGEE